MDWKGFLLSVASSVVIGAITLLVAWYVKDNFLNLSEKNGAKKSGCNCEGDQEPEG